MYKKLNQIAEIKNGYNFRGSIENEHTGSILVLQAKNLTINQNITDLFDLDKVSDKGLRSPFFLEYNDVLIVSRGFGQGSFRSAIFNSDCKKVMPSSSLHVIRLKDVNVLPKYLSLYLNSESGQKSIISQVSGGSYLQSILISGLSGLEIPVPPIHTQKSLISLHETMIEEENLLKRKIKLKQNIFTALFNNLTVTYDKK